MVGTGCCALTDSVELTRHAVGAGCRRVLMLPPFYYKGMSDEGLFRSFAEVIERVDSPDLRVFLYHFPRLSGCRSPKADFAARRRVSGDDRRREGQLRRLVQHPDDARSLSHPRDLPGLGGLPARRTARRRSRLHHRHLERQRGGRRAVFDAWSAGLDDADTSQAAAIAIRRAIDRHPGIPAQKFLIAHHRNDPAWRAVRPPMTDLTDDAGRDLLDALSDTEFDGSRLTGR